MNIIRILVAALLFIIHISSTACLNSRNRPETKLTDLYSDVLVIIIEDFCLEDLLHLAMVHPQLTEACRMQFWRNFKDYNIALMKNDESLQNIIRYGKCIEIYDVDTASDIWKCFARVIERLKIQNHDIFNSRCTKVQQTFDEWGSITLRELDLDVIKENTFELFTVPFTLLEQLSFKVSGKINQVKSVLTLPELFPALKKLNLELRKNVNYNFLGHTFPNLEHVFISISSNSWMRRKQIETFLKKNSHIQSIRIDLFPDDYIKDIKELLPNIQKLTLEEVSTSNRLQFNYVSHFKLYSVSPGSINKVTFPRLKSLEIHYSADYFNDWREFLVKHNQITRLRVTQAEGQDDLQLPKLTAGLAALDETIVECNVAMSIKGILDFLKGHLRLRRFEMTYMMSTSETASIKSHFKRNFKGKWKIRYFTSGISFERKMSLK